MPAMSQPAILPFVHAQGSWGEIGQTVGSMFAPLIADHVEAWTRHIIVETGATRRAVCRDSTTIVFAKKALRRLCSCSGQLTSGV